MSMPLDAEIDTGDDVLLARYARGDAAAARLLVARLTPVVFRHAARVLGDTAEAEDVTQEALVRLWKIAPDWEAGRAKVTTWLYRITANLCTDRLRKRRGVALDDIAEPTDPTPGVEAQLQTQARMDALQAGLMQLPERQRQAVILRHIEGLANPDIAQILDISTEAVESLTARGKRALATIMAPQRDTLGYDDDTA
ncbi:RNA polymerase sigma factor [Pseudosulfitobacter sp. SM2401]|uniref:RNA polymerase sigma factor n=1 Tax=Pseudosulfitobacter sp. SM2401 TaxID=3350098 RepID=UPI002A2EC446|nr:RNA polymerase sigma factor [Ascidiaceihabitans sp.]